MTAPTRRLAFCVPATAVLLLAVLTLPVCATEIWVAPTYQGDLGGLGVGAPTTLPVWPVTAEGAVRLAFAIPSDLQTFKSAKLVLITQTSAQPTLNLFVCPAQSGQLATAGCTGPVTQVFTSTANELIEVDISALLAPHVGTPGATDLAVVAFTTPTTATDHIVGMRFDYTPKPALTTYLVNSPSVLTLIGAVGTATATCNAGDRVVGGGHDTGASDILLDRSFPDTVGSWTVSLKPTAVDISWFAVAVCLTTP